MTQVISSNKKIQSTLNIPILIQLPSLIKQTYFIIFTSYNNTSDNIKLISKFTITITKEFRPKKRPKTQVIIKFNKGNIKIIKYIFYNIFYNIYNTFFKIIESLVVCKTCLKINCLFIFTF